MSASAIEHLAKVYAADAAFWDRYDSMKTFYDEFHANADAGLIVSRQFKSLKHDVDGFGNVTNLYVTWPTGTQTQYVMAEIAHLHVFWSKDVLGQPLMQITIRFIGEARFSGDQP